MLTNLYAATTRGLSARWAPIPLRLIVGYGFLEHGQAKLGRGVGAFAQILHALGMPFPDLLAWGTVLVEVIGGVAILLGAFVAFASVPMAIVLLVAIFTVHLPNGFSSIKLQSVDGGGAHFGQPGYETDLLYLAGLATLVLGGAGRWSVDGLIEQRSTRPGKGQSPPRSADATWQLRGSVDTPEPPPGRAGCFWAMAALLTARSIREWICSPRLSRQLWRVSRGDLDLGQKKAGAK